MTTSQLSLLAPLIGFVSLYFRCGQFAVYSTWKVGNESMKDRDRNRHPGPFRVMRADAEFAGILIAVSFVVLGLVGLPIAKWFLLGAGAVGIVVALRFRFVRGKGGAAAPETAVER